MGGAHRGKLERSCLTNARESKHTFKLPQTSDNCANALKRCVQAQRLFRDRLADPESKKRFDGMLTTQLRSSWGHTADLNGVSEFHQHRNAFEADELSKRVAWKERRRGRRAYILSYPGKSIGAVNTASDQRKFDGLV